jgi:hypothetical protein
MVRHDIKTGVVDNGDFETGTGKPVAKKRFTEITDDLRVSCTFRY